MIIYSTNKEQSVIRARYIGEDNQKEVVDFIKSGKVWIMDSEKNVWKTDVETFTKEGITDGSNEVFLVISHKGITPVKISNGESILNLAKRMMSRLGVGEVILIGQSADCFDIPNIKFDGYCYYCGSDPVDVVMFSE